MTRQRTVPKATVFRLSLYLRHLERLRREGRETVSSHDLGRALGLTDAQVRKDLTYFGQFGCRGVGYTVADLIKQLKRILGTDREWNVVVLGAGNLGRALSAYKGFKKQGFNIVALFDSDPGKIGDRLGEFTIQSMQELPAAVASHDARIGLICVPAEAAQSVADQAVRAGVRGLLNFAPVSLDVPEPAVQVSEDLAVRLAQLCFEMRSPLP
jgi:redox-sensing transcriptional repressor